MPNETEVDVSTAPRICHEDELFDLLNDAHLSVGHGKTQKTYDYLKKRVSNIARQVCELYVKCCTCQTSVPRPARPADFKPIISKSFNCRGQVDLIDMQSQADGEFKWIMHYQDHLTKFSYLRALPSKRAVEVARELLKIFLLQGAPLILQSDNGKEFVAKIIHELKVLWPKCKLVNGRPRYCMFYKFKKSIYLCRHPQSQGSVERGNKDVEDILHRWMLDNNSSNWALGIHFVQHEKNIRHHTGIKAVPYELLYGQRIRVGLSECHISKELMENLCDEENLLLHLPNLAENHKKQMISE